MRNQRRRGRTFHPFSILPLDFRPYSLVASSGLKLLVTGESQKNRRCIRPRRTRAIRMFVAKYGREISFPRSNKYFSSGTKPAIRASFESLDGPRDNIGIVVETTQDLSLWRDIPPPLPSCDRYACVCTCLHRTCSYAWLDREASTRGWRWYPLD